MSEDISHKFTEAGLGPAPFTFLGVVERVRQAAPGEPWLAAGTCRYCYTGIRHAFRVQAADGAISDVGSECIKKAGDKGLISLAKEAEKERRREAAYQKSEVKRLARLQAQRDRNGGLTDSEVRDAKWEAERLAEEKAREPIAELLADVADTLDDGRRGFRSSVAEDLRRGKVPTNNAINIACEIVAKDLGGRRGSKAYDAEHERVSAIFEKAVKLDERVAR